MTPPPPFCSTATKSLKTLHHHRSQSMQTKRASQEAEAKGTKAQREQEDTVAARAHPLARQHWDEDTTRSGLDVDPCGADWSVLPLISLLPSRTPTTARDRGGGLNSERRGGCTATSALDGGRLRSNGQSGRWRRPTDLGRGLPYLSCRRSSRRDSNTVPRGRRWPQDVRRQRGAPVDLKRDFTMWRFIEGRASIITRRPQ